ncbi:MAG TPA: branched-chain amino acid ABC transporter permease, partial [Candidatus Methylomirabilis sp.]
MAVLDTRGTRWFAVVAVVLLAVLPPFLSSYVLTLLTQVLIFATLAMSVDLLLGFTGMLSLGQALFFGLGAYTSALALKHVAPSFWVAMGITLAVATVAGVVGAVMSIRARGVYFALITFGMAQVVSKVVY